MKKIAEYVNVFQGNSVVDYSGTEGLATTWHPIKGMSGNTHPGAQLPFGKISACAYSGGYPTGYGNNRLNCGEPVEKLYDKKSIFGISHLQHSGTGAVGFYYNYALTVPYFDDITIPEINTLVDEKACPGYYSARFYEKNISFELTTDRNSAFHRYFFSSDNRNVMIDFSNDGLYNDTRLRGKAGKSVVKKISDDTISATVELQGLTLYFTAYSDSGSAVIWQDYSEISDRQLVTDGSTAFGVAFKNTNQKTNLVITISLLSEEKSLSDNIKSRSSSFEAVKAIAFDEWDSLLSRIQIEADDKNKEIFYSYLYHTLVKPSDWSGESIYYDSDDFVLDFTTLWDIYKTQLPLLFTVYPEIGQKIVNTYFNMGKARGIMPNLFDISSKFNGEAQQSRFLAGYLFCDAYYRGISAEWNDVLNLLKDVLLSTDVDFFEKGECSRTTHTLDMAEACTNLTSVAKELNRGDFVTELKAHSDKWKKAFDNKSGLLREDSEYYEGNHWNYSFRPMNSMDERIALAGGEDAFVKLLDRFFGFAFPEDNSAHFEGFNNETDMESPYAYNYVKRLDKLAEIIDAGNRYMFKSGEGGAPGNVDSGGLSACYIWNTLGVFPVSGQNIMLIGMPYFERVTLNLPSGKQFVIARHGNGKFVTDAKLDGENVVDFRFKATDMMNGGILDLYTE